MSGIDVVVIGLGATGSAALDHLARRGLRVVGVEQFTPGHDRGSSHGATRIIRLSYFEHPSYVPLVQAAIPLWRELEKRTGYRLLHITGILEMGAPEGTLIRGTLRASRQHNLPHEALDACTLMRRFPAFRVPPHFVGVYQRDGGFLAAEPSIHAHLRAAAAAGATVRTNTVVQAIEPRHGGVRIVTKHDVIEAQQAVVAAGPWLKTLLPQCPVPLRVTRQVVGWFAPNEEAMLTSARLPVFLIDDGEGLFYGFPPHERPHVKFAKHHHQNEAIDPRRPIRAPMAADIAILRHALRTYLPAADGPLIEAKTCLYTMTPDGDFILDRLPNWPEILVASPCSGHGFKFSPVIGEILADLATGLPPRHDISRFRLARFGEPPNAHRCARRQGR